ncbi:MAG: hypothetical protein NWR43_03535 [Alphaproteobacteria bacterium]|nr:hypothetical protein [Alphaproteobacteria bacterium]
MKISNLCKVGALAVSLAVMGAPSSANAISTGDMVNKIVGYIAKKGASKMCIKGNILNGVVSIRSFEGNLCSASAGTAGLALATCFEANAEKFNESGCFKKAVKKLGLSGTEGTAAILAAAKTAMEAEITKAGSSVAKLACTKASTLPDGTAKTLAMSKCPA